MGQRYLTADDGGATCLHHTLSLELYDARTGETFRAAYCRGMEPTVRVRIIGRDINDLLTAIEARQGGGRIPMSGCIGDAHGISGHHAGSKN